MILAVLNILVALFLGYGAIDEFWQRGVRGGEVQPLVVGLVGAFVSLLLALSGIWLLRRRPNARTLTVVAGVLSIVFHVYAALPPHRNVGILVLLVGAGYGLLLLAVLFMPGGRRAQAA
jgi:cyanate permease